MADDLTTDIKDTKAELKHVRDEIAKLNKRLDEDDFTGTVRYSSQEKVEAALKVLTDKEARLDGQLKSLYDTRLAAQQQQSGAGTCCLCVKKS
jgi:predicted translin family RNA/ssDNA-binding protein